MNKQSGRAMRGTLAGALLAMALQCHAAEPVAGCQIEFIDLPVKVVGDRAIATVGINGTQVPLIVDSGAFFSSLAETAAAQLHLRLRPLPVGYAGHINGLTGAARAARTTVDRLELPKDTIRQVEFVVAGGEDRSGAMGLLGRNILSFTDAEYDLAHGMVRLAYPRGDCGQANMAYWSDADQAVAALPLLRGGGEDTPALRADVQVNGRTVTATFDTGAPSTTLSLKAAHQAGLHDADLTPDGRSAGINNAAVDAWSAPVDQVVLGVEAIDHNRLRVANFDTRMVDDMLIGIDFFLSHRVYVSRQQSKMYFTYNGGPVFRLNASAHDDTAAGGMTAQAYARRAAESQARGDSAGTLADLAELDKMLPPSSDLRRDMALLYDAMNLPAQSLAQWDQWVSAHPRDAGRGKALNNRCWMRVELNVDLDKALADCDDAIATDSKNAGYLNSRAWVYLRMGRQDQALADFDRALSIAPRSAWSLYGRAQVRLALNQVGDARTDVAAARQVRPDIDQIAQREGLPLAPPPMP